MSEPIDFYGVAWPRVEPARDELTKLRALMEAMAAQWIAVAETDSRLLLNPAFTAHQRERLKAAGDARRGCAAELREAIRA